MGVQEENPKLDLVGVEHSALVDPHLERKKNDREVPKVAITII